MDEKKDRFRSFALAFGLSFVLLSVIMMLIVLVVQPVINPQAQQEPQTQPQSAWRPPAVDTFTLAVMGSADKSAAPFSVLLIRFNPQYGQIPLTVLPMQSQVTLQAEKTTLAQVYEKSGGKGVREALQETLGVKVDRYVRLEKAPFLRIAEKVGSVVFEVPYDISYSKDGYEITIPAGERQLDGQDVANILGWPELTSDPEKNSQLAGELIAAIINQNKSCAFLDTSPSLFKFIINLIDTDINYSDYEQRQKSANFLAGLEADAAGNLPLSGSLSEEDGSFLLSENYLSMLRQYFEAI